jgi:UDP-2,3-diacylglucosamine pyrophosphatase LpxH
VSDVHFGIPGCKAASFEAFLKTHRCDKIYLVGDIVDGWYIKNNNRFWLRNHKHVLQNVLRDLKEKNTEIVYVVGNHDKLSEKCVNDCWDMLDNVSVVYETRHIKTDGKILWVVHGDQWDINMKFQNFIEQISGIAYRFLAWLSCVYDRFCESSECAKPGLINFLKRKIRKILESVKRYERAITHETISRRYDGVVCGHIHHAVSNKNSGIEYWNTGDWVTSCTAIVEDFDGNMSIVRWDTNKIVTK